MVCNFVVNLCSAQAFLFIKAFEDQRPLPYASVANLTNGQLYFSNEDGGVSGNFQMGDSVFISYVGYQHVKARIENVPQTFLLNQSAAILEAVKIVKCKDVIRHEYSNLVSDTSSRKFGGVGQWSKGAMNNQFAVMLTPGIEDARLHAFSIWLETGYHKFKARLPKISIQAPLIFSFYSVNDSTLLPGELISHQQIIYYPKKEGRQVIQIDSLQIRIPKQGIYVAFQYVYNEKHLYPQRYLDREKGIDSIYLAYGARIDGVYSREIPLAFFDHKTGAWMFPGNRDRSIRLKPHGTIKFSAQLSSCNEKN